MADDGAAKKRKIKDDHAAKTKRQVMTRMMDKVSDDFVNNFADTRIDEGPEAAARNAQLMAFTQESQARAAREEREARENAEAESQQTFKGFAALMGRKNTAEVKVGGMFARLLGDDADDSAGDAGVDSVSSVSDLSAQPVDGVIKTRAGGKRRGLYTSCMNKPVLGGEPFRPMTASQDPSINSNQKPALNSNQKPALDIAGRVAAAKSAQANQVKPVAPASNQAGWKKIDAEPLSKLAEAAKSANNLKSMPAAPEVTKSGTYNPQQTASESSKNDDDIPASTAKSIKERSEAMAKMLPSGAREFTLPPMPSAAELSTLRRLANDGKGTKAIPASAFEQVRQPEPEVLESMTSDLSAGHSSGASVSGVKGLFGKFCAGIARMMGKAK